MQYKLKENVKFEELEKFGYHQQDNKQYLLTLKEYELTDEDLYDYRDYIDGQVYDTQCDIIVNKYRELKSVVRVFGWEEIETIDTSVNEEYIQDLIDAGFVEKIEEEK